MTLAEDIDDILKKHFGINRGQECLGEIISVLREKHVVITDVEALVRVFMEEEHLRTFTDRLALTMNELGGVAKIYTHNTQVNPKAIPVKGDMKIEMSDLFMMTHTMCNVLGLDPVEIYQIGMERLRQKEYMTERFRSQHMMRDKND